MDLLVQAGLYGDGLVRVDSPALIDRYNRALSLAGLEPTSLTSFQIDGIGWSPQIAEEKSDPLYLSNGIPTQMGIIVSPVQEGRPIFFPFRSFDRALMRQYFASFRRQIVDITTDGVVLLEVGCDLTDYECPRDLLLVDHYQVRSNSGDLVTPAAEQRALIDHFLNDSEAWMDASLRQKIVASASEHGDLRQRQLEIPDMQFPVGDFFTRAFGGVFVLRGHGPKDILVIRDPQQFKDTRKTGIVVLSPKSDNLLDVLWECKLVEVDLDWYRQHPETLNQRYDRLVMNFLCESFPDADFSDISPTGQRRYLRKNRGSAPTVIFELERLRLSLFSKHIWTGDLSPEMRKVLMHPAGNLSPESRDIVWKLICLYQPWDVLRQYIFCRNDFFADFQEWCDAKQRWATKLIKAKYRRVMDS